MYYKLEDNQFVGFYEEAQEEGTFVEISIEDWQAVLNKQAEGETIYYNVKNKKLETILLGQFETLNGTSIETDILALKKSIISELSELKCEYSEKEFIFQEKYLQRNRELDKNNLNSIVTSMIVTKKETFDGWKFKNKERTDEYVTLTMQDVLELSKIMTEQTKKAMLAETVLRENLANLSDEELKNYNVKERYEKAYKNM